MLCATCGQPKYAACACWPGQAVALVAAPPVHTCSTCAHWLADDPATRYRADCGLGEMTKPEAWQGCTRWAEGQSGCRG